jgi:hypothetical protein
MIGEKNIKAILQRLDRLTQDEARTTASETLKVIYGLVQNMTEVMNGEQIHIAWLIVYRTSSSLDGRGSIDGVREALGMFRWQQASSVCHWALEILHEMASAKNKSKRQFIS